MRTGSQEDRMARLTRARVWGLILAVSLAAGCGNDPRLDGEITFETLLHEMTNVQALAELPIGRSGMSSSYDRSGGNRDWGDFSTPCDGSQRDVLNLRGPGVVHRIWLTGQDPAQWRIYVDGGPDPIVAGIDPPEASTNGLRYAFSRLQSRGSGGYTSYVPIPFSKALKIAVPADYRCDRPYWQINYELYPRLARVRSLGAVLSPSEMRLVDQVREALGGLDAILARSADDCGESTSFVIPPAGTQTWLESRDAGVLRAFWLRLRSDEHLPADKRSETLRRLVLRIFWDGLPVPSVNVPLGDFFCNAFRTRRFSSLALARIDDRYICRFPMPFGRGARAELANESDTPVCVDMGFSLDAPAGAGAAVSRFHCEWNQTAAYRQPPGSPHRVLHAEGKGHLVGCYLVALGAEPNWFILEGDDTIRRDGERMPSFHGTGLEDYFNGAWYYFGLSDLAFDGLLEKAGPRTCQYRYHFPDRLEFERELRFDFEFGHVMAATTPPNTSRGYMSSAVFWYQSPARAVAELPPARERVERIDPLKEWTIMAEMVELELAGLGKEARERAAEYAARYAGSPTGEIMALRDAAYAGAASEDMRRRLPSFAQSRFEQVRAYAKAFSALCEEENRAFLHIGTSASFVCRLDGAEVLRGNDPRRLHTVLLTAQPGEHELVLELLSPGPGNPPWLSATVQTAGTNLFFTTNWDVSAETPAGWPTNTAAMASHRWRQVDTPAMYHPRQENWALAPNPFPWAQSQALHRLDRRMFGGESGRLFYRKRFKVEEGAPAGVN